MDSYLEILRANDYLKLSQHFNYHGIDEEVEGATPLYWAVHQNNLEFTLKLIEMGADVNKEDRIGRTHLEIACYFGFEEIVIVLLQNGAKINSICFERSRHDWEGNEQIRILQILIEWELSQ